MGASAVSPRFAATIEREAVWVYSRPLPPSRGAGRRGRDLQSVLPVVGEAALCDSGVLCGQELADQSQGGRNSRRLRISVSSSRCTSASGQ
jgi:hypothetical protein